jgi:DNA-directed RNA polymerase subunit alpha
MTFETTTTPVETPAGTPISDLNLSVRARKAMTRFEVGTIERLTEFTAKELSELKNFGAVSLQEVRRKLADRGLKLKDD